MSMCGSIYKITPGRNPNFKEIVKYDKLEILNTKKFDELIHKRSVSINGYSCDFTMIVNGKELNSMFKETTSKQRVKEDFDFYLILWEV